VRCPARPTQTPVVSDLEDVRRRTTAPAAHHSLFAYDEDGALVDHVAPFLAEGLRRREATVLVVDPRKRALLAQALGDRMRGVDCIDRDTYYTRPEDALAGYDAQVRRYVQQGAPRVRVFGELPLCRTERDSATWIMYEALLNAAFAHHPVTIVCGLDAREQPAAVIEGSWETHPRTMNDGWSDNDHYHSPEDVVRARTPPPGDVSGLRGNHDAVRAARAARPAWPPRWTPRRCPPRTRGA